jgi:glutamine amidotransferase-like uncharacterized protein
MFIAGASSIHSTFTKRNDLSIHNRELGFNMGTVNTWRYVGYTYDYNTGSQRLFVDGVQVKEGVIGKQEISTNYKV